MQVHRVFISRKSKSDTTPPVETGYRYSQVNNDAGTLSMFGSDRTTSEPVLENYSELKKFLYPIQYDPVDFTKQNLKPYEPTLTKRDLDYAIAKAESKYNANFLPSKGRTDIMYERLKSAMNYEPDYMNEMISRYDSKEYHTDDDDIRTGSRGVYDNWPLYHHNPYEYEHIKMNAEVEKAKDKRYAVDSAKVIPIHEDLSDDIPNSYEPFLTTEYYFEDKTTDNPMTGHDPFFSFVLNDYFDKNYDGDHLSFRGIHWGKDFDIEDYSKRNRRLDNSYHSPDDHGTTNSHLLQGHNNLKAVNSDTIAENGFKNEHGFNTNEKGDKESANDKTKYGQNDYKHIEFKDFLDSFANKFGSEDNKKDSKFVLKRNQDNGEKKTGFHRVYHKDEYQVDNEFYNNNNNSAKSEEKGSANAHNGASQGLLSSHAVAALGNQSINLNKEGDAEKNRFVNNHAWHDKNKGFDKNFNRHRDLAKQTALSNRADYDDHYRT